MKQVVNDALRRALSPVERSSRRRNRKSATEMPPLACACPQGPRDRHSVTSVACGCLNTGVHPAARKPSDGAGDETRVAGTWRISEMELWA
jgi:hypothetical protein